MSRPGSAPRGTGSGPVLRMVSSTKLPGEDVVVVQVPVQQRSPGLAFSIGTDQVKRAATSRYELMSPGIPARIWA